MALKIIEAIGNRTWKREGSRINPIKLDSFPNAKNAKVQRAAQLARGRFLAVHMKLDNGWGERFAVSYSRRRDRFTVRPRGEQTFWSSPSAQQTEIDLNKKPVQVRIAQRRVPARV